MTHRVGVVGGDGIGPEVIAEGLKVIAATGVSLETIDYDLGGGRYLRDGVVLDDSTVDEWRGLDALYVGAVGTPEVPPGVIERGLLLKMRFDLDLYINHRVGFEKGRPLRGATRIGVFDDRYGGTVAPDFRHQFVGRVGVVDVVEAERFALNL